MVSALEPSLVRVLGPDGAAPVGAGCLVTDHQQAQIRLRGLKDKLADVPTDDDLLSVADDNGVPPEVFNKALDDQEGIVCHECSVAGEAIAATDTEAVHLRTNRHPESPLPGGGSSGVAKRRRVPPLLAKSAAKGIAVVAACSY